MREAVFPFLKVVVLLVPQRLRTSVLSDRHVMLPALSLDKEIYVAVVIKHREVETQRTAGFPHKTGKFLFLDERDVSVGQDIVYLDFHLGITHISSFRRLLTICL